MAEAEIQFDGRPFVPSKIAAKATGYTQDYIGQLARSSVILAHRVGGLWYINLDDLVQHKKDSEAYVPEPPQGVASNNGSIVSFDGKEYIASKRAAQITGYSQDYVGQLARSGKIQSRQVAGRWYVGKDDLRAHKQEKDSLLAAVQAEAVGVKTSETPIEEKTPTYTSPLYTYVKEEDSGLPRLSEKAVEPLHTESRSHISDYVLEDKEEDPDAIHHIAIRAMHRDVAEVARVNASQVHESANQDEVMPERSLRVHRKRQNVLKTLLVILFLLPTVLIGGFVGGVMMSSDGSPLPESVMNRLRANYTVVSQGIMDLMGTTLTYTRK